MATPLLCDACGQLIKKSEAFGLLAGVKTDGGEFVESSSLRGTGCGYAKKKNVDVCAKCKDEFLAALPDYLADPIKKRIEEAEKSDSVVM